jgi:hypothetical protein
MSWLSDASANRIKKAYIKNFFDLSGNFKVRNAITTATTETTTGTAGPNDDWSQLGSTIDGEASYDRSGYSVSLSSDGSIVAIGAIYNDGGGSNSGHVRVFQYENSAWNQLGSDIDGNGGDFGNSVSLSSDGTILAIGAFRYSSNRGQVKIYEYDGSAWSQIGGNLDGASTGIYFGISVSLSSDGTEVAIGAHWDNGGRGSVSVYQYTGTSWSQLGSDMDGEGSSDRFGMSVSLSDDGTRVAMGGWKNSSNRGHARVYEYSGGSWSQLGSDIDGEASGDRFGFSVSLNSDGTILAVGAPLNDGNGSNAGHARVYEYSGGSWSQLGSDIDGEAVSDYSGVAVSLSSDGTRIAIGAYLNDGNDIDSGHVRVYEYSGGSWTQLGSDMDGEDRSEWAGQSVSLSSDGSIVAVGAEEKHGFGSVTGHTRVYNGFGTSSSSSGSSSSSEPTITVLDVSGGTVNMLQNTMDISSGVVDISGTTWINRGQSSATIADAYQGALIIESNKTSSSDAVLHVETAGQTQAFSVRADGSMYSANTLRHSSDDRRKINEQYITNATETINKLSPQIYTKLNDLVQNGGTPTKTESGLIAQEIYYNAPELRHLVYIEDKNGNKLTPQEYDLSGTDIQNDPDYSALGWGNKSATVDYIGLIPYLIKSNQEQQETIDNKTQVLVDNKKTLEEDLQTRISALEA